MKDKTRIIICAMTLLAVLVALTVTTKILVDGNVRVTQIKELKK